MAARTGLASSKVMVDRAMKACRKARLLSLYPPSYIEVAIILTDERNVIERMNKKQCSRRSEVVE